jgi:hypothetical protein
MIHQDSLLLISSFVIGWIQLQLNTELTEASWLGLYTGSWPPF